MATRDLNTLMLLYLQDRYSVTNPDLQTLVQRYLEENPNGLDEATAIYKELEAAALAQ